MTFLRQNQIDENSPIVRSYTVISILLSLMEYTYVRTDTYKICYSTTNNSVQLVLLVVKLSRNKTHFTILNT